VGRQDADTTGLVPLDDRLEILGASSDYLILDAMRAKDSVGIGDEIVFSLNYAALLAVMDSGYVEKRYYGAPN
jgi:predicted amino acid racemase